MHRVPSVLGVRAAVQGIESAIDDLERRDPERYREFWKHFSAAMRVLQDADALPRGYGAVFSVAENENPVPSARANAPVESEQLAALVGYLNDCTTAEAVAYATRMLSALDRLPATEVGRLSAAVDSWCRSLKTALAAQSAKSAAVVGLLDLIESNSEQQDA